MRLPVSFGLCLIVLALAFLPVACSKNSPSDSGQDLRQLDLEQIGEVYHSYLAEKQRPPKKLADVTGYGTAFPQGMKALKEGRCQIHWGLDVAGPDAGAKILAYEKDVPQQGGLVLMGDRTIKRMTAEEFQGANRG